MNKVLSRYYLTAGISCIVGIVIGIVSLTLFMVVVDAPRRSQQKREAVSFFYKTVNELFEDTYNTEDESVSEIFLGKFREYKSRLGGKCQLFVVDSTPGYYECLAFFPSGDFFTLAIEQRQGKWVLEGFHKKDW